jgi:hypothetical protein
LPASRSDSDNRGSNFSAPLQASPGQAKIAIKSQSQARRLPDRPGNGVASRR